MKRTLFLLLGLACGKELTKVTWDEAVSGKTVFVKFFASWCGHCKNMKPDWDKLMEEFEGSPFVLVADVDCTAGGESKCQEVGVRGYPTIKYGDPDDLQDYNGGRSFADLQKFAQGLGPSCGPANLDLCDEEKKKLVEEYMALDSTKRESMIKEKADFQTFVEGLQKKYQEKNEKRDKDVEAVKNSGLGLLKAVSAFQKKAKGEL